MHVDHALSKEDLFGEIIAHPPQLNWFDGEKADPILKKIEMV